MIRLALTLTLAAASVEDLREQIGRAARHAHRARAGLGSADSLEGCAAAIDEHCPDAGTFEACRDCALRNQGALTGRCTLQSGREVCSAKKGADGERAGASQRGSLALAARRAALLRRVRAKHRIPSAADTSPASFAHLDSSLNHLDSSLSSKGGRRRTPAPTPYGIPVTARAVFDNEKQYAAQTGQQWKTDFDSVTLASFNSAAEKLKQRIETMTEKILENKETLDEQKMETKEDEHEVADALQEADEAIRELGAERRAEVGGRRSELGVNLKETVEDRQETEDDLLMDLQGQVTEGMIDYGNEARSSERDIKNEIREQGAEWREMARETDGAIEREFGPLTRKLIQDLRRIDPERGVDKAQKMYNEIEEKTPGRLKKVGDLIEKDLVGKTETEYQKMTVYLGKQVEKATRSMGKKRDRLKAKLEKKLDQLERRSTSKVARMQKMWSDQEKDETSEIDRAKRNAENEAQTLMDVMIALEPEFTALGENINRTQAKIDDMVQVGTAKATEVERTSKDRISEVAADAQEAAREEKQRLLAFVRQAFSKLRDTVAKDFAAKGRRDDRMIATINKVGRRILEGIQEKTNEATGKMSEVEASSEALRTLLAQVSQTESETRAKVQAEQGQLEGEETTTKADMQRVFSSFKEKLHSLGVNFTDAVDALSGGGFSTMTGEELAQVQAAFQSAMEEAKDDTDAGLDGVTTQMKNNEAAEDALTAALRAKLVDNNPNSLYLSIVSGLPLAAEKVQNLLHSDELKAQRETAKLQQEANQMNSAFFGPGGLVGRTASEQEAIMRDFLSEMGANHSAISDEHLQELLHLLNNLRSNGTEFSSDFLLDASKEESVLSRQEGSLNALDSELASINAGQNQLAALFKNGAPDDATIAHLVTLLQSDAARATFEGEQAFAQRFQQEGASEAQAFANEQSHMSQEARSDQAKFDSEAGTFLDDVNVLQQTAKAEAQRDEASASNLDTQVEEDRESVATQRAESQRAAESIAGQAATFNRRYQALYGAASQDQFDKDGQAESEVQAMIEEAERKGKTDLKRALEKFQSEGHDLEALDADERKLIDDHMSESLGKVMMAAHAGEEAAEQGVRHAEDDKEEWNRWIAEFRALLLQGEQDASTAEQAEQDAVGSAAQTSSLFRDTVKRGISALYQRTADFGSQIADQTVVATEQAAAEAQAAAVDGHTDDARHAAELRDAAADEDRREAALGQAVGQSDAAMDDADRLALFLHQQVKAHLGELGAAVHGEEDATQKSGQFMHNMALSTAGSVLRTISMFTNVLAASRSRSESMLSQARVHLATWKAELDKVMEGESFKLLEKLAKANDLAIRSTHLNAKMARWMSEFVEDRASYDEFLRRILNESGAEIQLQDQALHAERIEEAARVANLSTSLQQQLNAKSAAMLPLDDAALKAIIEKGEGTALMADGSERNITAAEIAELQAYLAQGAGADTSKLSATAKQLLGIEGEARTANSEIRALALLVDEMERMAQAKVDAKVRDAVNRTNSIQQQLANPNSASFLEAGDAARAADCGEGGEVLRDDIAHLAAQRAVLLRRHTVADVRIRDALLGGAARLNRTNSTDPAGNETGSANHSFGARPTGS